mmetsp:Transcript_18960/g.57275  ORF Transcript_18960/g.57275 Transcript_18960/m.57275 type:complete len:218 (-) Transcript_18960:45-698(-)
MVCAAARCQHVNANNASPWQGQRSLRCPVILSIIGFGAGPIAKTVLLPAAICVRPASTTRYVNMSWSSACCASFIISSSVGTRSATLACPRSSHASNSPREYSLCSSTTPTAAWAHCAAILPLPIFRLSFTQRTILYSTFDLVAAATAAAAALDATIFLRGLAFTGALALLSFLTASRQVLMVNPRIRPGTKRSAQVSIWTQSLTALPAGPPQLLNR